MSVKKVQKNESSAPTEDQVRLLPIFGIRPGVYLACIYGFIILLALFFLLLYPGISNPGSVLVVSSEPWGAAILIDGVYMGAAPAEVFAAQGNRELELRLPGFNPVRLEIDVGGRLFGSLFFPKKVGINENLTSNDILSAFINEASEFTSWAFTEEASPSYQIPLTLSEAVYRFAFGSTNPEVKNSMDNIIRASSRFVVTRASLRDLIRAKTLFDNNGLSPSPLSLTASALYVVEYLNDNPMAALWLSEVLNEDINILNRENNILSAAGAWGGTIETGNLSFRYINEGYLNNSRNFLAETFIDSFYISETVITREAWELFIESNPYWSKDNITNLISEGLVSDDYLDDSIFSAAPALGIPGISWYSVNAFCQWLSSTLPSNLSGWEVRLPTEAEWEYAARAGLVNTGRFWEWCIDYYTPFNYLIANEDSILALGSQERSLRGGSWINPSGTVSIETRASLPPHFCSAFISARPIIARIRN